MAGRCIQVTAMLLAMLGAITLGLGVANVIAVYFLVYEANSCQPSLSNTAVCPYRNVVTLAFIGSGIWGSLVVFILSLMAIRSIAKQLPYRTMFMTATFVTAVVIIPTMIVLNAVNAAMTTTEHTTSTEILFNITATSHSASAAILFALPAAVSGVGFLEFLLMSGLIVYTCLFYNERKPSVEPDGFKAVAAPTLPVPPPAVIVDPAPAAALGPGLAYTPYAPLPYRRPLADYGYARAADPTSFYRPALRTPYMYPPAAAYRSPLVRPSPLSYMPPY